MTSETVCLPIFEEFLVPWLQTCFIALTLRLRERALVRLAAAGIILTFRPTTRRRFPPRGGYQNQSITHCIPWEACMQHIMRLFLVATSLLFGSLSPACKVDAPAFSSSEHHWCPSARNIRSSLMLLKTACEVWMPCNRPRCCNNKISNVHHASQTNPHWHRLVFGGNTWFGYYHFNL